MASDLVEICRVDMRPGSLKDNYYTLYTNGEVKREYDENDWQFNLSEWVEIKHLSGNIKQKMMEKAPAEYKAKAAELLGLPAPE